MRWWQIGLRVGLSTGIIAGLIVGLIAGLGGSVFTSTLADLATFAVSIFWFLMLVLPLLYMRNMSVLRAAIEQPDTVRRRTKLITIVAWLPAYMASVVAFMIPVVMIPFVLNKGVTFDNTGRWYDQVYTPLLNGPVIWVAIATIIGFAVVPYLMRPQNTTITV